MDEHLRKLIEEDIRNTARINLKKAFKTWGIERTEEKIKDLYEHSPKIKQIMLEEYFLLIGLDKR